MPAMETEYDKLWGLPRRVFTLFRLGLDLDIEDGGCFDLLSCVESMEDDTHLRPAPGVWPAAE